MLKYYPTLRLVKSDSPISGFAFQFCIIGTVALTVGIILCSYVVEQSTTETFWKVTKRGTNFRILWVQTAQNVNDQQFESFVLFAKGERTSIITSHPAEPSKEANVLNGKDTSPTAGPQQGPTAEEEIVWKIPTVYREAEGNQTTSTETLVIIAALAGVGGFILQFMGLRGMHWSASVIQVGATLVMTAFRAWVRRDLAEAPFAQPLPRGFELEWLATRLIIEGSSPNGNGQEENSFWDQVEIEQRKRNAKKQAGAEIDAIWGKHYVYWDSRTRNTTSTHFRSLLACDNRETAPEALLVRSRLTELTGWKSSAAEIASSLGKAAEITLNAFIDQTSDVSSIGLSWPSAESYASKSEVCPPPQTTASGPKSQPDLFQFDVSQDKGKWRLQKTQLEAVISLWMYALDGKPEGERKMQLLNSSSEAIRRDYSWWLKDGLSLVEIFDRDIDAKTITCDESEASVEFPEVKTERDFFGHDNGNLLKFHQDPAPTKY